MKFLLAFPASAHSHLTIYVIEDHIEIEFAKTQIINNSRDWTLNEFKSVSIVEDEEINDLLTKAWDEREIKYRWGHYEGPGAFVEYENNRFITGGLPDFLSGYYSLLKCTPDDDKIIAWLDSIKLKLKQNIA